MKKHLFEPEVLHTYVNLASNVQHSQGKENDIFQEAATK